MKSKNKLITTFITDIFKIIDKHDSLKDFFNDYDEILSSSTFGKFISKLGEKAIKIDDLEDAYIFLIHTAFFNLFLESITKYNLNINNINIPQIDKSLYRYEEFNIRYLNKNSLLIYLIESYKKILLDKNIENKDIQRVIKYIKDNIVKEIIILYEEKPIVLKKFIDYIKSDIYKIEHNDFKKKLYRQKLQQRYNEVIFNDTKGLTLRQIYIEPNFKIFFNNNFRVKYEQDIHTFLDKIIDKNNTDDYKYINTIFILGYPGQGKSSFVKRVAYDIISNNSCIGYDVIVINFKDLDQPKKLLTDNLERVILGQIDYDITYLDDYIIILDGLDELYMKSDLDISDIDTICDRFTNLKFNTIITSRLNYITLKNFVRNNILVIQLKEFNEVQQKSWLAKYKEMHNQCKLSSEIITKINTKGKHYNKHQYILELIQQPILLHMVAQLNIDDLSLYNRSKLYQGFFNTLIERKWDKEKHTLFTNIKPDLFKDKLRKMLQELAFTIYYSNKEYIKKDDFNNLETVQEFSKYLNLKNISTVQKLKGVMVAFYFKETYEISAEDIEDNYAIEFLHKSLMEYMVAEYIWENILKLRDKKDNHYIFDKEKSLQHIWDLFHKKVLTDEIIINLIEIIGNNSKEKQYLRERLNELIDFFIDKKFYRNEIEIDCIEYSLHTFYGFWSIFSYLGNTNRFEANDNIKDSLVKLFKLFRIFYPQNTLNFAYCTFNNIDFSYFQFENTILYKSDFTNSNLSGCLIKSSKASKIKLDNVKCNNSNIVNLIIDDNLINCSFEQSIIKNMLIEGTKKKQVVIDGVNFKLSIFDGLNIKYTIFKNCNFNTTLFNKCFFSNVILINCTLNNAIFKSTKFYNSQEFLHEIQDSSAILINHSIK